MRSLRTTVLGAAAALACALAAAPAAALVPQAVNYQGVLRESNTPVTGTRQFEFYIFTAATGGTQLYDSGPVAVAVSTGLFRYTLMPPSTINWQSLTPYIEVHVGPTTPSNVLTPRDPIVSSAFALFASTAETVVAGSLSDVHIATGAAINPAKIAGTAAVLSGGNTFFSSQTVVGALLATSSATASAFFGDGSHLTNISGALPGDVAKTDLANTFMSSQTYLAPVLLTGSNITLTGAAGYIFLQSSVTASAFFGDGSHLSGVAYTGATNTFVSSQTFLAPNLHSGTNVLLTGTGGYISSQSSVTASAFFGDGSHLYGINTTLPSTVAYTSSANTFTSSQTFLSPGLYSGSSITLTGVNGYVSGQSSVTASAFFGDGSHLSGVAYTRAANTFTSSQTFLSPALYSGSSVTLIGVNGYISGQSSITASAFFGDGSHLANISGALPGDVAKTDSANTFASSQTFLSPALHSGSSVTLTGANGYISAQSSITASAFFGDGSHLTNVTATLIPNVIASSITIVDVNPADSYSLAVTTAANRSVYNLVVSTSGYVGIGTASPSAPLEVQGGPIKATGGFILPVVTSDPSSPQTGQMWLIYP